MKKHVEYLKSLDACQEAIDEAAKYDTLQEAWDKSKRGDWMLWLLGKQTGRVGSPSRRKLVFTAAQCAKLALPYTTDVRVAACIEACEAYANGSLTFEDLKTAAAAATAAEDGAEAVWAAEAATATAWVTADAEWAATAAALVMEAAGACAADAKAAGAAVLKQCAVIVRELYPKVSMGQWKLVQKEEK